MVADLSVVGTLTGGNVKTTHILVVEPVTQLPVSLCRVN